MFKSLEVKYPKFYQVFRFIIVIIASVLLRMEFKMLCQSRRPAARRLFRSLPVISGNRTTFFLYQHPIYNIQCGT